ncbi:MULTISPECIES: hypothetical protein [Flammeovirga]|uniref:Uncharacterized protein n=1 Tax=Flammeovirga agarivorans TaxID=2726742 RepID=A0A7X8SQ00_9BACT|nr:MULTISPECIES: hypothetical protein [Flammeovirga]NLR94242.1 hypothetical protein [Flammeovirga agarivorans]
MNNIKNRFFTTLALITLGALVFSCSSSSGNASSSYFQKERKKYEVMDMHSDCPQLVKSRR